MVMIGDSGSCVLLCFVCWFEETYWFAIITMFAPNVCAVTDVKKLNSHHWPCVAFGAF